jgi:hypothetical protein
MPAHVGQRVQALTAADELTNKLQQRSEALKANVDDPLESLGSMPPELPGELLLS